MRSAAKEYLHDGRVRKEIREAFGGKWDGSGPESETLFGLLKRPEVTLKDILASARVREKRPHRAGSDRGSRIAARDRSEVRGVSSDGRTNRSGSFRRTSPCGSRRTGLHALRSLSNEGREKLTRVTSCFHRSGHAYQRGDTGGCVGADDLTHEVMFHVKHSLDVQVVCRRNGLDLRSPSRRCWRSVCGPAAGVECRSESVSPGRIRRTSGAGTSFTRSPCCSG